jgi:hypothetical protein
MKTWACISILILLIFGVAIAVSNASDRQAAKDCAEYAETTGLETKLLRHGCLVHRGGGYWEYV